MRVRLLLIGLFFVHFLSAQNLFQNPSFEIPDRNQGVANWSSAANRVQDSSRAYDGNYSYSLLPSNGNYTWQMIPVANIQVGEEYTITAYTKSIGMDATASVYWRYVSNAPLERSAFINTPADTSWVKHEWKFTPQSATNNRVDLYFDYAQGAFYIDSVSFALSPDLGYEYKPYHEPYAPPSSKWPSARLNQFATDIVKGIYDKHVVRDADRYLYGMTYQHIKFDNQTQEMGLNAMHHGFRWMGAMLSADLAFSDLNYYDCVCKYQIPFYTNLLNNSDTLFPAMQPRLTQSLPYTSGPIKGWIPRGWEDGLGFKLNGNQHIEEYSTCSNHLMQYVSDGLLYAYMFKEEDRIKNSIINVYEHVNDYVFANIIYVDYPQAVVLEDSAQAVANYVPYGFVLEASPVYSGAYLENRAVIPSADDGLFWNYTQGVSEAVRLRQEFDLEHAYSLIYRAISYTDAMAYFFDTEDYQYGLFDYPAHDAFWTDSTGKLNKYFSETNEYFTSPLLGTIGVSNVKLLAGLLPVLRDNPDLWSSYYDSVLLSGEQRLRVNIWDKTPVLDGIEDSFYDSLAFTTAHTNVKLMSDPYNLNLLITSSNPSVQINFETWGITAFGRAIQIDLDNSGAISIINSDGDSVNFVYHFNGGSSYTFELSIPFGIHPDQTHWTTVAEFSRYQIYIDNVQYPLLFMSTQQRIMDRMEHIVLGTIETWYNEFQRVGYVPAGHTVPPGMAPSWNISESGGAAALLETIALWEIYLNGTSIWEALVENKSKNYHRFELPDSVLNSLGLQLKGQSAIDPIIYKASRNRVYTNDTLSNINQIDTDFFEGNEALKLDFTNKNELKLPFHDCHNYSLDFYDFDYFEFAGKSTVDAKVKLKLVDGKGNESDFFEFDFTRSYRLFQINLNMLNNPNFEMDNVDYAIIRPAVSASPTLFLDKIELTNDFVNAIEDVEQTLFTVFPNPTDKSITIRLQGSRCSDSQLRFFDINGQLLWQKNLGDTFETMDLDVSRYPEGTYLLEFKCADARLTKKVVLIH